MTLGELVTQKNLVGRVFRAHEKNGFAYRGIVEGVEPQGNCVIFTLENHARRFEGRSKHSNWRPLGRVEIGFRKDTPIKTVEEIIAFTISGTDSRIYLYPKGTKVEELEHAPLA